MKPITQFLSEITDEQLEKNWDRLRHTDPPTGDIQEALMNRITALEKRMKALEIWCNI